VIGPLEFILFALIVLVIVGRNRLPAAGRSLGGGIRNFIAGIRDDDDDDEPAALAAGAKADRDEPPGSGPAG
jgi:sec-independent protein translocase protein TatA